MSWSNFWRSSVLKFFRAFLKPFWWNLNMANSTKFCQEIFSLYRQIVAYCKGIKWSRLKNATKKIHPIVSCTALLYALTVTICLSKSGKEGRIDIHSHKYMKFGVQKLEWGNFYVIFKVRNKTLVKTYNIDLIQLNKVKQIWALIFLYVSSTQNRNQNSTG